MTSGPLEWETCRDYVRPRLEAAGWSAEQIVEQFRITDGRIVRVGKRHRREEPLRADYLLQMKPGVPVAVVEAKREYRQPGDGMQQGIRYAELLNLPLAYSTNGKGIVERDFDEGTELDRDTFPSPDEAYRKLLAWRGMDEEIAEVLELPFNRELREPDGTVKEARYYQQVAISKALQAIVAGDKRLLLTMATGTGKTFTALQIVWKLWLAEWPEGRKPRVLYLADRNILVDQPIDREFRPVFGDAVWKLKGEAQMGRDIYFALYQALADTGDTLGIFRDFPSDYFDFVVVDECHRGSARDESSWRGILDHFAPATQLGMTATPRRDDNIDTYNYFGAPLYTYSLKDGIDDGFLAPYRVRRVTLSPDAHGWSPDPGQLDKFGKEIPEGLYTTPHFERVVSLLSRTEVAARHLTRYLQRTDPMAKTIVFCVDATHAQQMRRALIEANPELVRQHPDYVVRIVHLEGDVGMEHLGRFADPEAQTPVIATTSKLLSTGVDMPTVSNIVLFKPIGSIVDFKQIIGRGTRLYPDEDKLSFEIIDYSGASALFEDPDFDGPPEEEIEEEIDDDGELVEEPVVEEPEVEFEVDGEEIDEEDVERRAQKYYVEDTPVYVLSEGFYLPDPSGRLRLVEYSEYVADHVRRIFSGPGDLRARWRTQDGRDEVVRLLAERGIAAEELAERAGHPEMDPFDLLVFMVWNTPAIGRRERVRRMRKEHGEFFEALRPEGAEILDALLEKYAEYGPDELNLEAVGVPPLSALGTPVEIADRFGGPDQLRKAVDDLQDWLYAA